MGSDTVLAIYVYWRRRATIARATAATRDRRPTPLAAKKTRSMLGSFSPTWAYTGEYRDALISSNGSQGTILTPFVSTGPAVRASAVALGAHVGGGVGSPDRRDTCRRASHLGPAVHRTGRSNPNRERSVRASRLVVSWCPPCGRRGSAPFPVVTRPAHGTCPRQMPAP